MIGFFVVPSAVTFKMKVIQDEEESLVSNCVKPEWRIYCITVNT